MKHRQDLFIDMLSHSITLSKTELTRKLFDREPLRVKCALDLEKTIKVMTDQLKILYGHLFTNNANHHIKLDFYYTVTCRVLYIQYYLSTKTPIPRYLYELNIYSK